MARDLEKLLATYEDLAFNVRVLRMEVAAKEAILENKKQNDLTPNDDVLAELSASVKRILG